MRTAATLDEAVTRLRREYTELPGLSLTPDQARRLCFGDSDASERALELLVRAGVLSRREDGQFVLTTHRFR
jgi:hypothetical protein